MLLAGYLILRWALPASPWWLDLLDTFALYLFVPTPLLFLLGILFWSRSVLLLCAFPIAAFVILFGSLFLPRSADPAPTENAFTVMTYNVLGMNRSFRSMGQLFDEESPDVVALQELTPEIATPLVNMLSGEYPYRALELRSDFSGVGIFSRFPIKEKETFATSPPGNLSQHLVLDVRGREVHIFNVHPNHPHVQWATKRGFPPLVVQTFDTEWQTAQVEATMREVEKTGGPLIALGDFNLTDQTRQYRRITRSLTDAYRTAGSGFGLTFPANGRMMSLPLPLPVVRIDYVFHSPELVATETHLGSRAGSDHYPVIARLAFKAG